MRIRILPLVIGGAGLVFNALGQSPESSKSPSLSRAHESGTVTMSLAELKALWEKSQDKPPVPVAPAAPPVPAFLQSLEMEISLHPDRCTGVVKAKAASLIEGWQEVPLFGGDLAIDSASAEARVSAGSDAYTLLLDQKGSVDVEFAVSLAGTAHWTEDDRSTIHLPPSTFRRVLFKNVPDGMTLVDAEKVYLPSKAGEVLLTLRPTAKSLVLRLLPAKSKSTPVIGVDLAQATVSLLKCTQRVVMDGGLLTQAEYSFKHQKAVSLVISLPSEADLLQCTLEGVALRPERRENEIEVQLAHDGGKESASRLQLTYFTKLEPLNRSSGSLTLSLPGTVLFHERLDWTISLPDGMTASALNSNADTTASVQGSSELILKREFWKGDPVSAEVFYQKQKP